MGSFFFVVVSHYWLMAYPLNLVGDFLPPHFSPTVATLLLDQKVGHPVKFQKFADKGIKNVGWSWPEPEPDYTRQNLRFMIERTVIEPLENFGILSVERAQDPETEYRYMIPISFQLTSFGFMVLTTVQKTLERPS